MSGGLVASVVAAHSPRMGVEDDAPEFIHGLIEGLKELGRTVRAFEPDAIVLHSAHWVSTFWWYVPRHTVYEGVCVADEAPDLIPGSAYRWPGEPELAESISTKLNDEGLVCRTFDTPHWNWDYGCYVPLNYMDPDASLPVVLLPTVMCSDVRENRNVGRLVHSVAKASNKRIVFVSSCALSHEVVRGPELWPTEERQRLDRKFIELTTQGRVQELCAWMPEFVRDGVAEMGGRTISTMVGGIEALADDHDELVGQQFGPYAQSSGSGNAHIAVFPKAP
jgi:3,4-dihydroxyphenylacetate 2,3-dioxygenase